MKDIFLLIKERKWFYLVLLCTTLIITLSGSFNIISTLSGRDLLENSASFTEEQVLHILDTAPELFTMGAAKGLLLESFLENYSIFCFVTALLMIIAVMVLCDFGMGQNRTREFLETLPVKRAALELHNYVALFGILIANVFVVGIIGIIALTSQNKEILLLKDRFPGVLDGVIPADLIFRSNIGFLWQLGVAFLCLLVPMTFFYLCGSIFKNRYIGLTIGALTWFNLGSFCDSLWVLTGMIGMEYRSLHWGIESLFDTKTLHSSFMSPEPFTMHPVVMRTVLILIALYVVMMLCILLHAHFREFSKGRLLYVNTLQILYLVIAGCMLFVITAEWISIAVAAILTIVAEGIGIWFLYHKKVRMTQLAVTEHKNCANPLLKTGLPGHLIAGGIFTLIVAYICISDLEASRHFFLSHDYMSWNNNPNEILNILAINYYFEFLIGILIIGMGIFKGFKFLTELKPSTREFLETLPMSRSRIYFSKVLMDFVVVALPIATYFFINLIYRVVFNRYLGNPIFYRFEDVLPTILTMAYTSVFTISVLNLIDAVTVNGGLKIIHSIVTGFFLMFVMVLCMEIPGVNIFTFGISESPVVCLYLIAGIVFLAIGAYLFHKRDASKDVFYYGFAKHLFALQLVTMYLIIVLSGTMPDGNFFSYALGIIGGILIYLLTVMYSSPKRLASLKAKFGKKIVK